MQDEHGQSSVSQILLMPIFLMMIFGIVQIGMIYHANNVAHAAADAAYNAARLDGASAASGRAAAGTFLDGYGTTFNAGSVNVNRSAADVEVVVTGKAPSIVPLWDGLTIHQEVSGPTERWISR